MSKNRTKKISKTAMMIVCMSIMIMMTGMIILTTNNATAKTASTNTFYISGPDTIYPGVEYTITIHITIYYSYSRVNCAWDGAYIYSGDGFVPSGVGDYYIYHTFSKSEVGSHSLQVRYDAQNGQSNYGDLYLYDIQVLPDDTPPITTHTISGTLGNNGWYATNVNIALTATDTESGVNCSKYKVNLQDWQSGSSFGLSSEGCYDVYYYSADKAGNVETTNSITVKIDKTLPQSNNILINSNAIYTNTTGVALSLSTSDSLSGVWQMQFSNDNATWGSWYDYSETTSYSLPSGDGTKTVYLRVKDQAGNIANSIHDTIILDQTKPTTEHSLSGTSGSNGWYTGDVTVTLTASDTTSGISITKYKTDSGDWETGNIVTLTQDGTHTVYYKSQDNAGNWENENTVTLEIDKTPPTTTDNSDNIWHNIDVTVLFTPTDSTSMVNTTVYGVNDNTCPNTGTSIIVTTEGTHTVYYKSRDNAGNWETVKNCTVKIDKTKPSTTHSISGTAGSNGWYTSDVVVSLTPEDITSGISTTKYKINTGEWQTGTSISISSEGTHTVYYYSVDNASNQETEKNFTIKTDKTAPSTTDNSDSNWHNIDVTITLTPTDTVSNINTTIFGVDDDTCPNTGTSIIITAEGFHTIYYKSKDNAGLWENIKSCNVKIDKTKPTTTHALSPFFPDGNNDWYASDVTVTLTGNDVTSGVSTIKYKINTMDWQTGNSLTLTNDGTYIVYYYSVDNASNVGDTQNVTFKIDKIAPTTTHSLSGTSGSSGWYVSDVTVSLSTTADTSGIQYTKYKINTGGWQTGTSIGISSEGTHTIYYFSVDNAGNTESEKNVNVKIDKTKPGTTHGVSGTAGINGWYVSDVTVSLTATDTSPGSGVANTYHTINSGGTNTGTSISLTGNGVWTIKYWSVDNAGNTEAEKSIIIKIDKNNPSVSLSSPEDDVMIITETVELSWSGSDTGGSGIDHYEVQVDDNSDFSSPEYTISTTSTSITTSVLSDNTYYWRVKIVDGAGNIAYSQTWDFLISTKAPDNLSITINNNAEYINNTNVALTLSASANAVEMCFSNNNQTWSSWGNYSTTITWNLTPGDGIKNVYFKCRNSKQEESNISFDSIILDQTLPVLIISRPNNGTMTNKENITVEGTVTDLNGISNLTINFNGTEYAPEIVNNSFSQTLYYLSNGTNNILITTTDNSGNTVRKTINVIFDPSMPTLIVYTPANNTLTNNSQCTVTGNTDPSYTLKINQQIIGTGNDGNFTATITLQEGNNIVNVTANNTAGTTFTILIYVILDTVAPSMPQNLTVTPNTWSNNSVFTIDWINPYDPSGIAGAWYKYGYAAPTNPQDGNYSTLKPLIITAPAAGQTQIFLWLMDQAGNSNHNSYRVFYTKYDPNPPSTTLLVFGHAGTNDWYVSDIQVELSRTDDLSQVKETYYNLNNAGWQIYNYIYPDMINITISGKHTISYYSVDQAGNIETVHTKTVMVDKDVPNSNITAEGIVGNTEWFTGTVTITLHSDDTTSGVQHKYYRIGDSGVFSNYTDVFTLQDEGVYKVYFYVVDQAGNKELTRCRIIGIDKTGPVSSHMVNGTAGLSDWYTTQVNITLTASDSVSQIKGVWYKIDEDETWREYSQPLILRDGTHTVTYYSVNCADIIENQKTINVRIDTIAPTLPEITETPGFVNTTTITVQWTSSIDMGSGFTGYTLQTSRTADFTQAETISLDTKVLKYNLTLPEGTKTYIRIMVWDLAGNTVTSNTVNTLVDTIPPETHTVFIGETYMGVYVTSVQLEFYIPTDSSGINTTYYYLNDADGWVAYTNPLLLTENRIYVLKYYAVDNAGNIEEIQTQTFKINISFVQPDVDVNEPRNITVEGNYTISWNMSSPIDKPLFVTIIMLQAENGQLFVIAEHILNITSYNIDTNIIPNGRFYLKIIIQDTYGRTVNSTTLTSININNPYMQQTWLGNQSLLTCGNLTEGSITIIAGVTNRKFNTTLFTTEIYIGGVYVGRTQKTLTSMEKQNISVPITLTPGTQWIQVKLYDGNTLIETITKSVIVIAAGSDTTPDDTISSEQKEEKGLHLDFWLIGLIIAVVVSVVLIISRKIIKKHQGKTNLYDDVITKNQLKHDEVKTEPGETDKGLQGKPNISNTKEEGGWE